MPTSPAQQQADSAKSSMGLATKLSSFLMPQGQAQSPQTPETAPQPPQNQETGTDLKTEMQGLESRIFDELGTLKKEIQKAQPQDANKELADLKNQLQSIIDAKE